MAGKLFFKLYIALLKLTEKRSQYVGNKVARVTATNVGNVTNK